MQDVGGNLQDNHHPGFLPARVMLCFLTLPKAFSDQDFLALGSCLLSLAQVPWEFLEDFKNGESGENLMRSSLHGK